MYAKKDIANILREILVLGCAPGWDSVIGFEEDKARFIETLCKKLPTSVLNSLFEAITYQDNPIGVDLGVLKVIMLESKNFRISTYSKYNTLKKCGTLILLFGITPNTDMKKITHVTDNYCKLSQKDDVLIWSCYKSQKEQLIIIEAKK